MNETITVVAALLVCWMIGYFTGETASMRKERRKERQRIREIVRERRLQEYDRTNPMNGGRILTPTPIGEDVGEKIIDEDGFEWYVRRPGM